MAQAKIISALPSRRQGLGFRWPTLLCDASGICVSVGSGTIRQGENNLQSCSALESNRVAQHALRGYTQALNGFLHNRRYLVVAGELLRRDTGTRAAGKDASNDALHDGILS